MKDQIIKQRSFKLVGKDGRRLDVVAKLYSLGGQRPHFSVTSQFGSNHEQILEVCPELEKVVRLHLSDANGYPAHAVENLDYYLRNQDFEKAHSHIREAASIEDLMILAGKAALKEKEVFNATEKRVNEEKKKLDGKVKALDEKIRVAEKEQLHMRKSLLQRDRKKIEEELTSLANPKTEAAAARKAIVQEFVGKIAPIWKKEADEALAFLDGNDFVAGNWINREADETTYPGFLATRGIEFEILKSEPSTNKSMPTGSTTYHCVFKLDGRKLSLPFHQGPGIADAPNAVRVLETIAGDARTGLMSFREFCSDLGYDEDSRSSYATWEACRKVAEDLEKLLGEEGFRFLLEKVEEDGCIMGQDPEEAESGSFQPR